MIEMPGAWAALIVSGAAVLVWGALMGRVVTGSREPRVAFLAMPAVGLVASIGTFASALGYGMSSGLIPDGALPSDWLTFVASMGRGALLMGGLMVLLSYHPPKGD